MKYQRITNALRYNRFFWGGCILILLLNFGYYVFFIQKKKEKIGNLQAAYNGIRNPDQGYLGEEFASYMVAQLDLNMFKAKLAPKEKFADRINELNDLIKIHGLGVGRISFAPERVSPQNLWRYTSSIGLNGSYAQLKGFLADLQNSRSIFSIDSISMLNRSDGGELVNMNLRLSTYFR